MFARFLYHFAMFPGFFRTSIFGFRKTYEQHPANHIPYSWIAILILMLTAACVDTSIIRFSRDDFDNSNMNSWLMGHFVLEGSDGIWTGEALNKEYVLRNSSHPHAVKYFQVSAIAGVPVESLSPVAVCVEVGGNFDGRRLGPGLIYDFDPESNDYEAFVLLSENRFGIFRRSDAGFKKLLDRTYHGVKAEGMNQLSIYTRGYRRQYLINGAVVHTSRRLNGGTVGIIAGGTGEFHFDNFTLSSPVACHNIR